jgi:hypothetical protein
MNIVRILSRAVPGVAVLAALVQSPATIQAQAPFQTSPTLFSGQATAVNGKLLGIPMTLIDTGTIAPEGGTIEKHLLCYPAGPNCTVSVPDATNGALGVAVLNATVVAQGHGSSARASVADLAVNAAGQAISATFIQARADARCGNGQATVGAESEIAQLVVNGQEIMVTGAVNQTVDLPNGAGVVVINEQTATANGGNGDVTVSALHVRIAGPIPGTDTDLVIAQAHADIQCGQRFCPADKDFVTGGGWLADPRRNFAVAGGIKNGGFWGHLLFIDHESRMKVKGTGVTAYTVTGPTTRHIEGTCEIDGVPGTYQVDVDDQGEPGRLDTFALALNGSPVANGVLSGGNIQLHTCK